MEPIFTHPGTLQVLSAGLLNFHLRDKRNEENNKKQLERIFSCIVFKVTLIITMIKTGVIDLDIEALDMPNWRKKYLHRKRHGVCVECNNISEPNHVLCRYHIDRRKLPKRPGRKPHGYYAGHTKRQAQVEHEYGLAPAQYDELVSNHDNSCAICKRQNDNRELSIDHCHETKKVRGLLCKRCNIGIGMFRDSPELMLKAIEYLKK